MTGGLFDVGPIPPSSTPAWLVRAVCVVVYPLGLIGAAVGALADRARRRR